MRPCSMNPCIKCCIPFSIFHRFCRVLFDVKATSRVLFCGARKKARTVHYQIMFSTCPCVSVAAEEKQTCGDKLHQRVRLLEKDRSLVRSCLQSLWTRDLWRRDPALAHVLVTLWIRKIFGNIFFAEKKQVFPFQVFHDLGKVCES